MIQYTVDDIMRDNPCDSYTYERVEALWGGYESLSPADIALLPIPVQDRVWALGRLLYRLSPHRVNRVVRCIALDVADLWDPRDVAVWYLGTGDEQARAAARDAASDAAWAAAMRRYLSWIVKAFDPFMPVGDISS